VTHPLQLLLLLMLIVVAARAAGASSNRLDQPAVFGLIAIGFILGPTVLALVDTPLLSHAVSHGAFAADQASLLAVIIDLVDIGVILLMFVAGMETDLDRLGKVGVVASSAALGGVVLLGVIVLSLVIAFSLTGGWGFKDVPATVPAMAGFFLISTMPGVKYLERVARRALKLPASQTVMAFVLAVTFLHAWAAEYLGNVAAIAGSYVAGVLFARSGYGAKIDEDIHSIAYSVFVPVLFVSVGLRANGKDLTGELGLTVLIVVAAVAAKVVGCAVGSARRGSARCSPSGWELRCSSGEKSVLLLQGSGLRMV
jgi:Kef-type K+ transport system membrane component KefB